MTKKSTFFLILLLTISIRSGCRHDHFDHPTNEAISPTPQEYQVLQPHETQSDHAVDETRLIINSHAERHMRNNGVTIDATDPEVALLRDLFATTIMKSALVYKEQRVRGRGNFDTALFFGIRNQQITNKKSAQQFAKYQKHTALKKELSQQPVNLD